MELSKKQVWIISIVLILVILFLFPLPYSYEIEDTCATPERVGTVNAWCIGIRVSTLDFGDRTVSGRACSMNIQGKRCMGLSRFEKLN